MRPKRYSVLARRIAHGYRHHDGEPCYDHWTVASWLPYEEAAKVADLERAKVTGSEVWLVPTCSEEGR